MPVIDTTIALHHLRDPEDDLPYIELLLGAAEDQATQYINRRFYPDADALAAAVLAGDAGNDPILVNDTIRAACLLILGHLYNNREDVVVGTIATAMPMGAKALLTPYRVGWGV